MNFYKTLKNAKNSFNKIGTPKWEELFVLAEILDGSNKGMYVVALLHDLDWSCLEYKEIDIKG